MLFNKWNFRCKAVVLTVLALLIVFTSLVFAGAAETPLVRHVTLTWTDDPQTTQTITWKTTPSAPAGQVEYAEKTAAGDFSKNTKKINAVSQPLPINTGEAEELVVHSATLSNLKPGTPYIYRLGDGTNWSRTYGFTTAASGISEFKFLVFGDSQSTNYDTWRQVVSQAYQANPDTAFITIVGDLVDTGNDYNQWNAWFEAATGVIDAIGVMPMTGNHENYTRVWRERSLPHLFVSQFKLPDNGPDGLKTLVYSFDYANAHIAILDSQEWEEASFIPDMLEKQKIWLENDLASTAKPWKLVFFHKPPYNVKTTKGRNNDNLKQAFLPIFDKYGVNIVFNGHDHVYARTYPLLGGKIAPGQENKKTAGTVYVTSGRSGTKFYQNDAEPNDLHEFFYNPADEPNYLVVEVTDKAVTVKAFKLSDSLLDSWNVEK